MNYILVKYEDYNNYVSLYRNNNLDKNNKIWTQSKDKMFEMLLGVSINEIFDSSLETKYIINDDGDNYLITFKSDSNQEYRFGLIQDVVDDNIYHLAFSTSDKDITNDNYANPTNKDEMLEILNRLIWILKDINLDVEYCIGSTCTKKDVIYKYLMRFVSNWQKRDCSYYKLGWELFFKV